MKKLKLKIVDTTFAHCEYSNNPLPAVSFSNFIDWDRDVSADEELVIYTDDSIRNPCMGHKKRIAWLLEPICKKPHNYDWILKNSHLFDYILTHDKRFVEQRDNFIYYPFGGCWVEPSHRKFHPKTKNISIICSQRNFVPDHYKRHELIRRWGDYIDVLGSGYSPIDNITDGLKDYAFHIAMENQKEDYYFTEKLINPIMTGTIPIYWGMPSIGEYFDTRGMLLMNDIEEFPDIYNTLNQELYMEMLPYAKKNFETAKQYILSEDWMYKNIFKQMGII
jgi:hypothetical protein